MQRILRPEEMRALEARAFALGVPSLLLMENAARAAHAALREILGDLREKAVLFLIGAGNNGGDGLAMARLLLGDGGRPHVLLADMPRTPDARTNLAYAEALGIPVSRWGAEAGGDSLPAGLAAVVMRCLAAAHGTLPESLARLAGILRGWRLPVIALDAPSGMESLRGVVGGRCSPPATLAMGT